MLKKNTNLTELRLAGNNLGPDAAKEIIVSYCERKLPNSLDLCIFLKR